MSTALTPVCAEIRLIALTTFVRLTPASAVTFKEAVATPLIVKYPAPVAATCAKPETIVLPTVAVTPDCEETALIAATLAIALEDLSPDDKNTLNNMLTRKYDI